ncbi:MAG: hypothetical protein REI96_09195 [Flavobacterium nitrogenifigens]|uniref:Uncharacterized protein n=1 Tax=Flavobacterium nitrogenifigens TaxID=1617283 RepID=A0A521ARU3_9FLAO|nr:hypothetical protein [Flavobacterium nitrogenifigens]KAF2329310.1 hypothetical protein DM397_16675 [Flavobacterium nitrogenifigens]MDQ8012612.1 hypothetical protein [Flavobacterium nitrogenifigens]SMO37491.1 hypothetical protein SAMN06265220_101372 [Flavobacterium nitrogenifigens]
MNSLRPYILLLFLVFGLQQVQSQSYHFKTSGFSVLEKNERGKWGEWSNLDLVNLSVVLDTNKHRIVVYSQEIQLYNILDYIEREENDTDITYSFICKDNDGRECKLSIITRKKQDYRKQLYINYDDHIIVYNIITV